MSGLVALFNRNGRPVDMDACGQMMKACPERGPDGGNVIYIDNVAIGHQLFLLLPEEINDNQPLVSDGIWLTADVRLDNRQELGRHLDLSDTEIVTTSDAKLILLAYLRWGEQCPQHLLGDFAFIVWDNSKQRLFAVRDSLGARDLCYYFNEDQFLIASEISQILAHPDIHPEINDNRVAAYLLGMWDRPEETFYRGITYLSPAHAISVTGDGVDIWRYWSVQPEKIRYKDERQYAEHYRELISEAVRCRLRCVGKVGLSLSGGLDSTFLAALAVSQLSEATGQKRLHSFSYVFDELASCDERAFIRPVVERYGLEATYIHCDDLWAFKDLENWPVSRDYVISDIYALLPAAVRSTANQTGIRALFAGYYGDALMSGGHYWALDMAREGKFGSLIHTAYANWSEFKWRDSFIDFGLRRLVPPVVAQTYRSVRPRQAANLAPGIHEDLPARTDLASRLSPQANNEKTFPGFRQRYETLTGSNFSHNVAIRYQYNHCGMELIQPYYDRRLVEFVLSVPAYVLGRPGSFRHLHRESMSGLLPDEVRLRRRRTTFAPLIHKGIERERLAIRELMNNPLVVKWGYIRRDWLETMLESNYQPSSEWALLFYSIFLELWLQRYWN